MAITREQIKAANKRGSAAIARGPVARAARYDAHRADRDFAGRRLRVLLSDGIGRKTDGCTAFKTEKIEISPNGLGLHWPQLDADPYVPALIEGAFGSCRWMQHIGELGSSARSAAKAKAARENGTRGGRPKDEEAA
jgi:hypothetical protein